MRKTIAAIKEQRADLKSILLRPEEIEAFVTILSNLIFGVGANYRKSLSPE